MMAETIAQKIIEARAISVEKGRVKYNSYFVTSYRFFKSYKDEVDAILVLENCKDVIL